MSWTIRQHTPDDLALHLKGLIHVRALLEAHGASRSEIEAHSQAIDRVRAELAGIAMGSTALDEAA